MWSPKDVIAHVAGGAARAIDYATPGSGTSTITKLARTQYSQDPYVGNLINTAQSQGKAVKQLSSDPNDYVIIGSDGNIHYTDRANSPSSSSTGGGGSNTSRNASLAPSDITGGAGGGSQYTDTSAARAATQSSIDSLDEILANKLAAAQKRYDTIAKGYDAEDAQNQTQYDQNVTTNEQNREAQHQAALLAAATGQRGLFATLAAIGALGGTGQLLARRAVANEANKDIGDSNKTFDTNATSLFDAFSRLKQQEEQRRRDAEAALASEQEASRYDVASTRQGLLKDLADLFAKAGLNTESADTLGRASALNAELVRNTRPQVASYATTPLNFTPPALKNYLAGANDMTVKVAGNSQSPINGAIYTSTKKRDDLS